MTTLSRALSWLRREHRLATGADFPTPAQLAAIKARAAALDEKRRREVGYWHRVQCRLFANRADAVRVNGLGAQADAVTSYSFNDDWEIYPLGTDALEGKGWVIVWPARILVIGDPGELDLARYVASTRSRARGPSSGSSRTPISRATGSRRCCVPGTKPSSLSTARNSCGARRAGAGSGHGATAPATRTVSSTPPPAPSHAASSITNGPGVPSDAGAYPRHPHASTRPGPPSRTLDT